MDSFSDSTIDTTTNTSSATSTSSSSSSSSSCSTFSSNFDSILPIQHQPYLSQTNNMSSDFNSNYYPNSCGSKRSYSQANLKVAHNNQPAQINFDLNYNNSANNFVQNGSYQLYSNNTWQEYHNVNNNNNDLNDSTFNNHANNLVGFNQVEYFNSNQQNFANFSFNETNINYPFNNINHYIDHMNNSILNHNNEIQSTNTNENNFTDTIKAESSVLYENTHQQNHHEYSNFDLTAPLNDFTNNSLQVVTNETNLLNFILKEIEMKKLLIRLADTELKMKQHFCDITKNLFVYFSSYNKFQHDKNANDITITSDSRNLTYLDERQILNSIRRPILIAYLNLIDNNNNRFIECMNKYENSLNNLLNKIYASIKLNSSCTNTNNENILMKEKASKKIKLEENNMLNLNNGSYSPISKKKKSNKQSIDNFANNVTNPSFKNHKSSSNFYANIIDNNNNLDQINLNLKDNLEQEHIENVKKLKTLHFVLLLFSSYISINDSMLQLNEISVCNNNSNSQSTGLTIDISTCQKVIIQMIDKLCKDNKPIKTKILLTISEFDLI